MVNMDRLIDRAAIVESLIELHKCKCERQAVFTSDVINQKQVLWKTLIRNLFHEYGARL